MHLCHCLNDILSMSDLLEKHSNLRDTELVCENSSDICILSSLLKKQMGNDYLDVG